MTESTDETTRLLGEAALGRPGAFDALIIRTGDRLRSLTRRVFQNDFPRLARWEETDDVVQDVLLRLSRSIAEVKPANSQQFFGLAATQLRRSLLDLVRRHFGSEGHERHAAKHHTDGPTTRDEGGTVAKQPDRLGEPKRVEQWRDFYEALDRLPEKHREMFDLLFIQELTRAQTAKVLNVHERTVRRRWLNAQLALGALLKEGSSG